MAVLDQSLLILLIILCSFVLLVTLVTNHGITQKAQVENGIISSALFCQRITHISLWNKWFLLKKTIKEMRQILPPGGFQIQMIFYEPLVLDELGVFRQCCIGARIENNSNQRMLEELPSYGEYEWFRLPQINNTFMAEFPFRSWFSSFIHSYKVYKSLLFECWKKGTDAQCFVEIYSVSKSGRIHHVETHSIHGKSAGGANLWCYAKQNKKEKRSFTMDYVRNIMDYSRVS